MVKDQAELEAKVALLEGKGTVGPGVDGSFGEFPSLIVNPAPRNCQDVESPAASLQLFAWSRR